MDRESVPAKNFIGPKLRMFNLSLLPGEKGLEDETSLTFLYRNIKHCSSDIKNRCYKIFIQPILEYTLIVWSPYYDKYVNKLEAVQRRMARFVCNEYGSVSVTNLLKNLSWPTLQ